MMSQHRFVGLPSNHVDMWHGARLVIKNLISDCGHDIFREESFDFLIWIKSDESGTYVGEDKILIVPFNEIAEYFGFV